MPKKGICWLRRDLRLEDHAALAKATEECERVAIVFIYDSHILDELEDEDDRRITFIKRSLDEVQTELHKHHSELITRRGKPEEEIPKLAKELKIEKVYANSDIDPYAWERDDKIKKTLEKEGVEFEFLHDVTVREPEAIKTKGGDDYKVFTPYMKAWRKDFDAQHAKEHVPDLSNLWPKKDLNKSEGNLDYGQIGFRENSLWLKPGASGAKERLDAFMDRVHDYERIRNDIAANETSGLSVHLRHGTISPRECVRRVRQKQSEGADAWLTELIWREFYYMILARFPKVTETTFQEEFSDLDYPGGDDLFEKWCDGQTGFPIVDAGMRCLNETGWMHNRMRMIVASFLTKDLLVWWKKGELYFARKLLDFDLANNNGGWQWAASTGVDAQPYFRIFNPVTQSERFDKAGEFIREWCPELSKFSGKNVHFPDSASEDEQEVAGCVVGEDYPEPIVDHSQQRERVIALLKEAKNKNK
jgi:deoxyribodipyrimidine photo-lyase